MDRSFPLLGSLLVHALPTRAWVLNSQNGSLQAGRAGVVFTPDLALTPGQELFELTISGEIWPPTGRYSQRGSQKVHKSCGDDEPSDPLIGSRQKAFLVQVRFWTLFKIRSSFVLMRNVGQR